MRRATVLLTLIIALVVMPATADAATAGGLKQLSGAAGCLSGENPAPPGCGAARGLSTVGDVVTTEDGRSVYVSSTDNDTILVFDRDAPSGALTQKSTVLGCVTANPTVATADLCNLTAAPMSGPRGLAVSADGKSLYTVTNAGRLTSFNRASDGSLTYNDASLYSSGPLRSVTVSPDGQSVYIVGPDNSEAVGWYRRSTTSATLGDIAGSGADNGFGSCYGGVCGGVSNQGTWSDVAVTPDGKELLVTASSNSVLLGWDRDTSSGALTPSTTADRCVSASLSNCQSRLGINSVQSLAVLDNDHVNLLSQYGLSTVARNASNNVLTPDTTGNCFTYPTSAFAGCTAMPGGNCCSSWYPARDIVGTPDGENLYVGTEPGNPGIFGFDRNAGSVALKAAPLGCVTVTAADTCSTFRQGNRIQALAASNDSRNVYAGGNSRLFTFQVDRVPVCQNVNASTPNNASVTITLNCSDPDGDPLTFEKVSDPSHGTLAGIGGNTVSYGPQPGTTGMDAFQYRALGAGVASDPATATISVTNPRPPGPDPTRPLPSTASISSLPFSRFTKIVSLSVQNLPAGSIVTVTCKTKKTKQQKKGCPYKRKRLAISGARAKLNLGKPFAGKKVPVGSRITIAITAPGFIGKQISYTIRKRKAPKSQVLCIPPGGRPGRCV